MKFQDLQKINARYAEELKRVAAEVIDSGWYLCGERVAAFERDLSAYLGVPHVVACGNGLDALRLILRAYIEMGKVQEGDEVIVPANTYVATVLAVTDNRLVPVFVEPSPETYNLDSRRVEAAVTARTKIILPVHLYGYCCWDEHLVEMARKYGLWVVEDAAQSIGAEAGVSTGCSEDGSPELWDMLRESVFIRRKIWVHWATEGLSRLMMKNWPKLSGRWPNYGSERRYYNKYRGYNSRLDELQAAFLSVKLAHLDDDNRRRQELAAIYDGAITAAEVIKPQLREEGRHIYHQYVVRVPRREELIEELRKRQIPTLIHYPVPPHRQVCYEAYGDLSLPITERLAQEVLSLPISPVMTEDEVLAVSRAINDFYK